MTNNLRERFPDTKKDAKLTVRHLPGYLLSHKAPS